MIFVLAILVLGASMAAAVGKMSASSATQAATEMEIARARAAADSGVEWGRWALMTGPWMACVSMTTTLDLRAGTGKYATVSCTCSSYSEGLDGTGAAATTKMCEIRSVACPSSSCPDDVSAAKTMAYTEWERSLTVKLQ